MADQLTKGDSLSQALEERHALTPLGYELACIEILRRNVAISDWAVHPGDPWQEQIVAVELIGHYPDAVIELKIHVGRSGQEIIVRWHVWGAYKTHATMPSPVEYVANKMADLGSDTEVARNRASRG